MSAIPVVLDTNALLLPFLEGTNLEAELEDMLGNVQIVVPSSILGELKMLAQGHGDAGQAARGALRLLQRFGSAPTGQAGDDGLLDVARRLHAVVVTNDRKLQEECRKSSLRVVVARGRGRLAMSNSGSGSG